nr:unnamed protein product [Digitaria exilis]
MEAAVSSSLGAMGPVLRKLDLLLYHLRKALRDGIELLKEDLQEISSALVELSTLETPTLRAKCWMAEARELSYLIEDFVDDMMWTRSDADSKVRSVCRHRHRVGRVKIAQLPQKQRRGTRIARITQLRDLVRQASERHERYQLDAGCTSSRYLNTGHMRAPTDAANLFGIENSRIKLIEMLTVEEEQQLKVVSIVGPAGVGFLVAFSPSFGRTTS